MESTSRFSVRAMSLAVAAFSAGVTLPSHASMGNIGTTYGVMPVDVATAQSLSMFNDQVSATYYNPAYLTKDERGELTTGLLHAEQELRASNPNADGDILSNSPSQHVLIGMKTNLSSLTRFGHPIYLGFIAGVEKYGKEMLAFTSETTESGQFLQYGKEPLFLNMGAATPLWRGISAGASVRITLDATANLEAVSTLGGETSREQLSVTAEPSLKAILGTTIDLGDTFCPDGDCFLSGWETALVYRTKSSASTTIDSNIVVTQTIPEPGLSLAVSTIDSFQPETFGVGLQFRGDRWRIGGSLEQQNWSELEGGVRRRHHQRPGLRPPGQPDPLRRHPDPQTGRRIPAHQELRPAGWRGVRGVSALVNPEPGDQLPGHRQDCCRARHQRHL